MMRSAAVLTLIVLVSFAFRNGNGAEERPPLITNPGSDREDRVWLNGTWKFSLDQDNSGVSKKLYSPETDDSQWETIPVPDTWNRETDEMVLTIGGVGDIDLISRKDYQGVAWYRRTFRIPEEWKGASIRLDFAGVFLVADVWLNGQYLGQHKGGYTGFRFDVSRKVEFAKDNVLVVKVDSRQLPDRAPDKNADWLMYGGIYREVSLEKFPLVSVPDVYLTPRITADKASVVVKPLVRNDSAQEASVELRLDVISGGSRQSGKAIRVTVPAASGISPEVEIDVPRPELWSPEHPHLYQLEYSWKSGPTGEWYRRSQRFGLRRIEVRKTGIYLNGKKIWLQGTTRHEHYPGLENLFDEQIARREFELIKEMGANVVRLGHYPNHCRIFDICDELGLLVWDEGPFFQRSCEELTEPAFFNQWVAPQFKEMIERGYNHPSIVFWSVGNELVGGGEGYSAYLRQAFNYIKSLDSTRVPAVAENNRGPFKVSCADEEVITVNAYPGWFHTVSAYDMGPFLDNAQALCPEKPLLVTEYGAESRKGTHGSFSTNLKMTEEYHDKILRIAIQAVMIRKDSMAGLIEWSFFDHPHPIHAGLFGVFTIDRRPKMTYQTLKNLYAAGPRVLLIDSNTLWRAGEKVEVEVWTFNPEEKTFAGATASWRILGLGGTIVGDKITADVPPDSSRKIGVASWEIPPGTAGFFVLVCDLKDSAGKLLHQNEYYFDVEGEFTPAVLWVRVEDEEGRIVPGARVDLQGRRRTIDSVGEASYVVREGKYSITVAADGYESRVVEAAPVAGKDNSVTVRLKKGNGH